MITSLSLRLIGVHRHPSCRSGGSARVVSQRGVDMRVIGVRPRIYEYLLVLGDDAIAQGTNLRRLDLDDIANLEKQVQIDGGSVALAF
jgi:hypothetical protein